MTVVTMAHANLAQHADLARTGPRGFVPPHGDAAGTLFDPRPRLSHLDPKPLWSHEAAAESPWRSPTFWLAYAMVMPVAALLRPLRAARGQG